MDTRNLSKWILFGDKALCKHVLDVCVLSWNICFVSFVILLLLLLSSLDCLFLLILSIFILTFRRCPKLQHCLPHALPICHIRLPHTFNWTDVYVMALGIVNTHTHTNWKENTWLSSIFGWTFCQCFRKILKIQFLSVGALHWNHFVLFVRRFFFSYRRWTNFNIHGE